MPDIISLISGGIIGGFIGAFLAGFAKFFWEHWLISQLTWRREQKIERQKLLSQFRDPAIRAAGELARRINTILRTRGGHFEYLKGIQHEQYYIYSTSFLIGQFFACREILRQQASMLDYSDLSLKLDGVTHGFSYGGPGFQTFKLEQRELGERMIKLSKDSKDDYFIGYSDFVNLMNSSDVPNCFSRLEVSVCYLFENIEKERNRLIRIHNALVDFIEFIDPKAKWVASEKREKFQVQVNMY